MPKHRYDAPVSIYQKSIIAAHQNVMRGTHNQMAGPVQPFAEMPTEQLSVFSLPPSEGRQKTATLTTIMPTCMIHLSHQGDVVHASRQIPKVIAHLREIRQRLSLHLAIALTFRSSARETRPMPTVLMNC
jgi:hypothetical protein